MCWCLPGACCAVKAVALPSLQRLAEWVAIQSVSAWPEKRGEIKRMMEVAAKEIERLGGTTKLMDIGKQKVCEHLHVSLWEKISLEGKVFCVRRCWFLMIPV